MWKIHLQKLMVKKWPGHYSAQVLACQGHIKFVFFGTRLWNLALGAATVGHCIIRLMMITLSHSFCQRKPTRLNALNFPNGKSQTQVLLWRCVLKAWSCLKATKALFTEDIHQVIGPIQDLLKAALTFSLLVTALKLADTGTAVSGLLRCTTKWLSVTLWVKPQDSSEKMCHWFKIFKCLLCQWFCWMTNKFHFI